MSIKRIDQVIPSLASRDAIGGHVLQLQALLRDRGVRSDIFYGVATADRTDHGMPVAELGRSASDRILLYQLSIGSGVTDIFAARKERKFVNYHNITPADLLEAWVPQVGEEVRWGREQLRELAPMTEFAVADSRYNEVELIDAGYRSTATVPLLLDLESFGGTPDPAMAKKLIERKRRDGGADLLFVGKISPHKGQHDLVKALAAYRALYDPAARLRIVGSPISEEYFSAVERFLEELDLVDAVEFPGSITHEELIAYYAHSDAFVCLSNHEGFCVPLVEAMYHRLPVVTYETSAVPETVLDAGVVLADKSPARVAAAIHRVVTDDALRASLAEAAEARVATFSLPVVREQFASALLSAAGV